MRMKNRFHYRIFLWSLRKRSRGFALLSSLMSITMVMIYALSLTVMIVNQNKELRKSKDILIKNNFNPIVANMFDNELCNCHLDASKNTDIPLTSSLTVDTTGVLINDIDLGSLRSGCDFTSSENIIFETGQAPLSIPKLVVDSIRISEITPVTGVQDKFSARLDVQYENNGFFYSPFVIPLVFSVDLSSGAATQRPIVDCEVHSISESDNDCYYVEEGETHVGCGKVVGNLAEGITAFGFQAGSNTTGVENTFVGSYSGRDNLIGYHNSFLGHEAGKSNTNGGRNVYVGFESAYSSTLGDQNVSVGYRAGSSTLDSSNMVNVGYRAGEATIKPKNVFIGSRSGMLNVNGEKNTFIGALVGQDSLGSSNTLLGSFAGRLLSSGDNNTFIGYRAGAGDASFSSSSNICIGHKAGSSGEFSGGQNIFIGSSSGEKNTQGQNNVGIGYRAGANNLLGSKNIFIGGNTGINSVDGSKNIFLGYQSGEQSKGSLNVFVGHGAGKSIESSDSNIFIGYESGALSKGGERSIYIGYKSGQRAAEEVGTPSGIDVVAIGESALANAITNETVAIGHGDVNNNNYSRGVKNVFVGNMADSFSRWTKSNSVLIGYNTVPTGQAEGSVFIGAKSGGNCLLGFDRECRDTVSIGAFSALETKGSNNTFFGYMPSLESLVWGLHNTILGVKALDMDPIGGFVAARNVIIGQKSTGALIGGVENRLVIGHSAYSAWLLGYMVDYSHALKVHGNEVVWGSSRALKRDIKPFTEFDKVLEDLIATPLFTYRYKNKRDFPMKERMGVIAEELPEHLQIKKSSENLKPGEEPVLPYPDWPSIYGSFWAGIKALYGRIDSLKKSIFSKFSSIGRSLEVWKKDQETLLEELRQVDSEVKDIQQQILEKRVELLRVMSEFSQREKKVKRRVAMEMTPVEKRSHEK